MDEYFTFIVQRMQYLTKGQSATKKMLQIWNKLVHCLLMQVTLAIFYMQNIFMGYFLNTLCHFLQNVTIFPLLSYRKKEKRENR